MKLPRSAKILALLAVMIAGVVIIALVRATRGPEMTLTFAGFSTNTTAAPPPYPFANFVVSNASERPISFLGPGYDFGGSYAWPAENMPSNGPLPVLPPHATQRTTLQTLGISRWRAVIQYSRPMTFIDRLRI